MPDTTQPPRAYRFGVFELDLRAKELYKSGLKLRIQEQPFQVLASLLERPGEVASREKLRQRIWGDTFVDFEHSLSVAVSKLRDSLGDSADSPRFIETLHGRGYRFIAPVERVNEEIGGPQVPAQRPEESPSHPVAGRRRWLRWVIAAVTVLAIGAGVRGWLVYFRRKAGPPEADLVAVPLTSYPGTERYPSFSPDGTQVAFQWCPADPGKSCNIYVKQIGVETPSRLTDTTAMEYSPVWSPDGRTIAFFRRLDATNRALVLIPQRGGRERVFTEVDTDGGLEGTLGGPYLAWTPDSKWLVFTMPEARTSPTAPSRQRGLYLFSVQTGEKRKLTNPPSSDSPAGVQGDTGPAFSPDGRILAFTRVSSGPSDLYLLRLGEGYRPLGEPERVRMDSPWNQGAAWTPDGGEIVFASRAGLWRMALSKPAKPRRLPFAPDNARAPAISRQGDRLAYSVGRFNANIWRIDLRETGHKPGAPVPFISSTRPEGDPAYSPDGNRITFVSNRSGSQEIWVCDTDGSNPVQLTSLGGPDVYGPRWSPDSQSIAYEAQPGGNPEIYVINAAGGAPRRLTTGPSFDQSPCWSHDGRWIYFSSKRSGGRQIWKMPAGGGEAIQITRNGGGVPQESADGKFVYYSRWGQDLWRVSAEGGEETKILGGRQSWRLGKEGIYFFTVPDKKGHSDLSIYEFATGKTRKILTIERQLGLGLDVSPDGRTILYVQVDEAGSDLMLVENFR